MHRAVRITGWALFAAGMAVFLLGGGFEAAQTSMLPWVGLGILVLGCLLTAASTLFASLRHIRGREDR